MANLNRFVRSVRIHCSLCEEERNFPKPLKLTYVLRKKKKQKTDTHLTQGRWSKVKHLGWLWWERHFVYSVVDNVSLLFMQAFGYVWLGENCDLT